MSADKYADLNTPKPKGSPGWRAAKAKRAARRANDPEVQRKARAHKTAAVQSVLDSEV